MAIPSRKLNIQKGDSFAEYQLLTYTSLVKPELRFSSTVKVFDSSEEATLQCTAVGGYPPDNSISLIKNGQVILNRASDVITYTTSGGLPKNVYGIYKCIVSTTAGTVSKTLLLQQKGV